MLSSRNRPDGPGEKLLPKIIKAVTQGVIATKQGLAGHEISVRQLATQGLIDKAGHEAAELLGPYIQMILDTHQGEMPQILRDYLEAIASGEDQIKALSGLLAGSVQSSLSSVISNYASAVAYKLNEFAPNLVNDPAIVAQAAVTGITTYDDALLNARYNGLQDFAFNQLFYLAQNIPDVASLTDMLHRGYLSASDYANWLQRLGFPAEFVTRYQDIQWQLLSVPDAALAVTKGLLTEEQGRAIAQTNGFQSGDWNTILGNTGEPPGPAELQEAFRRGFIDQPTFEKGIRESRVRDEWIQTLLKLRYSPLNTADAVNAYVEGYITEDQVKSIADQNGLQPGDYQTLIQAAGDPLAPQEMLRLWRWGKATQQDVEDALRRGRLKDNYIPFAIALKDEPMSIADAIEARVQGYLSEQQSRDIVAMNGLRPEDYDPLYLTAGAPLPKEEMFTLLRRGVVTVDQVKEALAQSRLKDSYIDTALNLSVQLPALYEVRALLADGSFTPAQGLKILLELGYTSDVAQDIVNGSTGQGLAANKALTLAMYTNLYEEGQITPAEFQAELKDLGYSLASGELIQAEIDYKIVLSGRNQVISKVRAAYIAGKVTEATAQSDLNSLDMPSDTVDKLIAEWDISKSLNIKLLTEAQVTDAWFMNLFSPDNQVDNTQAALSYLTQLGYDGADAVKILEIKNKGPLDNAKPNTTGSPAGATGQAQGSTGAAQSGTSGSGS